MTAKEERRVRKALEIAYGSWHVCGLDRASAKAMKLKKGRLCDDCMQSIEAHMKDIKK